MPGNLIIVESPTKGKKIQPWLGDGWRYGASMGHIRDMPKEYGVNLESFEEEYILRNGGRAVTELKSLVSKMRPSMIYIASDPDREGEGIAWHIVVSLGLKKDQYKRVVFNEVTPEGVRKAIEDARELDWNEVGAQRARRVLDRIVGYDTSKEICWPANAKSAGRVQTPALHMICERERAILDFVPRDYFTLALEYAEGLTAFVPSDGKGGTSEDEDEGDSDGKARKGRLEARQFTTREEAQAVIEEAQKHEHIVREVKKEKTTRSPGLPYETATVLQDAGRKLGFSVPHTTTLLQALFDEGWITYHRTDSTRVSEEGVELARKYIGKHQPDVLPKGAPKQRKSSGAQDAHEAIRPSKDKIEADPAALPADQRRLFEMIKARFLASQSKPAVFAKTTIRIDSGPVEWVADGQILIEEGFLVFWGSYGRTDDKELPDIKSEQALTPKDYQLEARQTKPPSRYDGAALVKRLKAAKVGRPSTYNMMVGVLMDRGYAEEVESGGKKGRKFLKPTDLGMRTDELFMETFPALQSEEYTAEMEASLDRISEGKLGRVDYLRDWYSDFRGLLNAAAPQVQAFVKKHGIKTRQGGGGGGEETDQQCDKCQKANYRKIPLSKGKGSFLACSDSECGFTRDVKAKTRPCAQEKCGGTLVERKRKGKGAGSFMACSRCNHTENTDGSGGGGSAYAPAESYGKPCPRCDTKELNLIRHKADPEDVQPGKSQSFLACSDRDCGFKCPFPAGRDPVNCGECGGLMMRHWAKKTGKPYYRCAKCPEVRFELAQNALK